MGAELRAGVIGLGILGAQHVRFLADQPEVEVVAVADILRAKAEEIGGQVAARGLSMPPSFVASFVASFVGAFVGTFACRAVASGRRLVAAFASPPGSALPITVSSGTLTRRWQPK